MDAAAKERKHLASVLAILRLAENASTAFDHRVRAKYDSLGHSPGDVFRLLMSKPGNHFRRSFAAANATLGGVGRRPHFKIVTTLCQQLAAPW